LIVSGVVLGSPAHAAGVLVGSTLLAAATADAGGRIDAATHAPVSIAAVEAAAREASNGLTLLLKGPGPLSAAGAEAAEAADSSSTAKSSSRRGGKRAAAKKKKQKKQNKNKKQKQKRGKVASGHDATDKFHAALQDLKNVPLAGAENVFFSRHFILKTEYLPRQARDKYSESSQKTRCLRRGTLGAVARCICSSCCHSSGEHRRRSRRGDCGDH
jgi:hypothetical protein